MTILFWNGIFCTHKLALTWVLPNSYRRWDLWKTEEDHRWALSQGKDEIKTKLKICTTMAQLTGIIHEYYYTQPPNTHHPTLCLHFTPKIIKKDLEIWIFFVPLFREYYKGSDFFRMSYKQAIVFCQTHIEIEKTSIHAKRKEGTGYFIVQLRCMHLSCNRVTELQNNCKNIAIMVFYVWHSVTFQKF